MQSDPDEKEFCVMNWFTRLFRRPVADWNFDSEQGDSEPEGTISVPRAARTVSDKMPSFSDSASSIEHRRRPNDERDRSRALRQAFRPSQPVQKLKLFSGRTQLLRRVIRAIQDQHMHVVVYGDRGIGKTSLLHVVRELAGNANYVVSYTSCGEDSDFYETMRTILGRIPRLFDANIDPTAGEVERGGSLADLLPQGNLTVAQISDVMANIEGTRVLILLDEFDRTRSEKFRNSIAELIKNLSDRSIKVQMLIAGVASNLTDLIAHVPSIRRNIIGIPVPNMTEDEVRQMLQRGFSAGKLSIDKTAMDPLVEASGGLPYLAALLGQHAAMACADAGQAVVSKEHVQASVGLAAEDIGNRLSPFSRHVVERQGEISSDSPLAILARCAVSHGGIISDPDALKLIPHLDESAAALLAMVQDDPLESRYFVEDGVSAYIWLRTAALTY